MIDFEKQKNSKIRKNIFRERYFLNKSSLNTISMGVNEKYKEKQKPKTHQKFIL